ncbi:MAG: FliM/FliN family flagellar motor switch protein [Rhizobiaceae bacterium]
MAPPDPGGTPAELQDRILDGLLSGGRCVVDNQPVSHDLPAKDILPALLAALGLTDMKTHLIVSGQSQAPLASWWEHHKNTCIAIRHASNEKDENPNYLMLPVTLVSDLLAVTLGGTPDVAKINRPPSRIETKFAGRLGPALSTAVNPLLRIKTHVCSAMPASAREALEALTGQSMHLIDLKLEWASKIHAVSIALSEAKIERRAATNAKPPDNREGSAQVVAEIGKTRIRVDVLVKIADQTLERLQNLRVGDVMLIAPNSLSEARMEVRGHEIYSGQIGHSGKNFGFMVSQTAQNKASGLPHMVNFLAGEREKS